MLSPRNQIYRKKALSFSNGYRELEMYDEALKELDAFGSEVAKDLDCQQMRLAILMQAKRWKEALPCAKRLAENDPSDPGNLVNLAYITRRAEDIAEARAILERAADRFPEEAIIHYNLGCYAASCTELETAKQYLLRAFQLDPNYLEMSASDSDLKELKEWIGTLPNS